ncbi:MAG: hypothetical protein OEV93_02800 [Candidatus Moranbacteria bacterium]|nr:hypothetical protein [Candidatus Moranbacteria bacterium]
MNLAKTYNPKNVLLAISIIAFLLIITQFFKDWSFPDTHWKVEKEEDMKVSPGYPITQKFISRKDNLSTIAILLRSSKKNESKGTLNLNILDEACENIIRKSSIKFHTLDSQSMYNFNFKKIKDSSDKTYCLKLAFIPKKEDAKDIRLFTMSNYSEENVFLYNPKKDREYPNLSLAMQPGYKGDNFYEDTKILIQRISQYKPWFLKDVYLFIIFLLAILLSIATVTLLIII